LITATDFPKNFSSYYTNRLNRSTKYLFPLLYDGYNVTSSNVTSLETNGFKLVNLFIKDDKKPEYDNSIFMLLYVQNFEDDNFKLFFQELKNHHLYLDYYNVDTNYLMIVFKVTDNEDYILKRFIRGKYSSFPKKYINFFSSSSENINCVYNVLTKNKLLKHKIEQDLNVKLSEDAELDDIPYLKEEIFRYEQ